MSSHPQGAFLRFVPAASLGPNEALDQQPNIGGIERHDMGSNERPTAQENREGRPADLRIRVGTRHFFANPVARARVET